MFQAHSNKDDAMKAQMRIFSQLPEFMVKDMAQWFWFMASHALVIHPNALEGLQV